MRNYQPGDVGMIHSYEDVAADRELINKVADNCYLPTNKILLDLINVHEGKFKISFSISGTTIELLAKYRPDVLDSFRRLVDTGCVEILAETYYHSLSFLHSKQAFQRQVQQHTAFVKDIFGIEPAVFRNTELIYNNELARFISQLGYKGLLCEGAERILKGRTPNHLYAAPGNGDFPLLLRNADLSDDIAFRFDDTDWSEHPLTAEKFAGWLHDHPVNTELINLFMDYETFGVHKKEDTGIFEFLKTLPSAVLANEHFHFSTPSGILHDLYPKDIYDVPFTIAWEDRAEINCVWSTNMMQNNMLKKIYSIERMVLQSESATLADIWGRLQAADHFYYMAGRENEVNKYHNPYPDGEKAFQNYQNILVDFEISLIKNNLKLAQKNNRNNLPVFNLY